MKEFSLKVSGIEYDINDQMVSSSRILSIMSFTLYIAIPFSLEK